MPRNPFDDDVSVLSEDKQIFSSSRSSPSKSSISSSKSMSNLSSQQQNNKSSSPSKLENKLESIKKRIPLRGPRFKRAQGPDDISISDSLCSGVLRDAASSMRSVGGSIGSSIGNTRASFDIGSSAGTNRSTTMMEGRSSVSSRGRPKRDPVPGGVSDFSIPADFNNNYNKKDTDDSNITNDFSLSNGNGPSFNTDGQEAMSSAIETAMDDAMRREQRKERVKEKLERYKRDQKQLKKSCVALEHQLAQTTEKLREVDSKAAFKIDALESELRETRKGMEHVAKSSTKEVTDQSECIKTLGKKLIRQAHVIKRQKTAVEQYKIQLEGLNEEMAMQDERDQEQEANIQSLQDQLDCTKEQKKQMQNLLQENIEEMMQLKSDTESDAKNIMELEFNLQQKEATLDRVAKDVSEKAKKISELEEELETTNRELESTKEELRESENSVQTMQRELESASAEIEESRCKYAAWNNSGGDAEGDRSSSVGASIASSQAAGGNDRRSSMASVGTNGRRRSSATVQRSFSLRNFSSRGGGLGDDGDDEPETFEEELLAKEATIQTLNEEVKEHEETINNLRSEMVKMSSTYKQDSYLKRKEIAKLKQQNAEYALKLRALEKAFKCVNATENMSMVGQNFHGHTMHGTTSGKKGKGGLGSSLHGSGRTLPGGSQHSKSQHSAESFNTKQDKAAAVKARLGGWAPYEFPSAKEIRRDSAVVQEAMFMDDAMSDKGSDVGRKGEDPEER